MFTNRACLGYVSAVVMGWAMCASGAKADDACHLDASSSEITFDVAVRSGSATIHATVFTSAHDHGVTVLAVPGGAGAAAQLGPLARAIVSDSQPDSQIGKTVRRIVTIDFPGHGDSPFPINLPAGTQFGDLLLEDDASILLQSIDKLRDMKLGPSVLLTHSLGGLLAQTVQQMLLSSGSSLAAHGVKTALLLAPVAPHGLLPTAPATAGDAVEFTDDPDNGTYLTVPTTPDGAVEFLRTCLSNHAGDRIPSAPTGEEILAEGYMATEPVELSKQTIEFEETLPDGETVSSLLPSVDAGAFAPSHGTRLAVVSFSEDRAILPANAKVLYEYLTGDDDDRFYREIVSPNAVHCMLLSDPQELLSALRSD